jgi:epoxyqueuosine reductase
MDALKMDKSELTRKIKDKAIELGFPLVGVTTADAPDHLNFFKNWLDSGYNASMSWLGTARSLERRSNPRKILPACQSILVLACPYPTPRGNVKGGNIASYALNQDYHAILEKRLKELMEAIESWAGETVPNRWYVDTGPLLEKELAMRAGLGWIGKNTTLINRDHGSYFFLSEILLGLELNTDLPITESFCGTCTRCLDTCPTGALIEPYTLDASRCISYLTIEHRDEIRVELRPKMGDWIFGCDICQIVCPWNKPGKQSYSILETLQPRKELTDIDLIDEMRLNQEGFSARFKGSPIKRTKRRGYLRNVAIALGNRGVKDAIPVLEAAQKDEESLIRGAADWALKKIKESTVR